MMPVKKIGLTGGIATGKSTVSAYLKSQGFIVLDSDQFAHEAYTDSKVFEKLKKAFPTCIYEEKKVDRNKLGELVFSKENEKTKLEEIIHPYVKQRLHQGIRLNENEKVVFLDIPLLFEAHMEDFCDEIWVVALSFEEQLERLKKRNGLTQEAALVRMNSQWPLSKKIAKSDVVIDNNGTLEELYHQINKLLEAYKDD